MNGMVIALLAASVAAIFSSTEANGQDAINQARAAREQVAADCNGVKSDTRLKRSIISMLPRDIKTGNYDSAKLGAENVLASNPTPAEQQCALSAKRAAEFLQSDAERRFAEKISQQAAQDAAAERANDHAEALRAEERRAGQATAETPNEKLKTVYQKYITMQFCYEARKEFRVQYVTKQELDDAKAITKRNEQDLIKRYPTLRREANAVWEEAKLGYQNTPLALSLGLSGTRHNEFADQHCKLQASTFTLNQERQREKIKKDF